MWLGRVKPRGRPFARSEHDINATTRTDDPREAAACVFSVMRKSAVPRGITHATAPNLLATISIVVAVRCKTVHFYQDTASPSLL